MPGPVGFGVIKGPKGNSGLPDPIPALNIFAVFNGVDGLQAAPYVPASVLDLLGKVDKVSSTDNALVRFDGTSGSVQNSSAILSDSGAVLFSSSSSSSIVQTIRGASGQTANLQEWQDSSGSVLSRVSSDGSIISTVSVKTPTVISTGNLDLVANSGTWAMLYSGSTAVLGARGGGYDAVLFGNFRLGFENGGTGVGDAYIGRESSGVVAAYTQRSGVGSTLGTFKADILDGAKVYVNGSYALEQSGTALIVGKGFNGPTYTIDFGNGNGYLRAGNLTLTNTSHCYINQDAGVGLENATNYKSGGSNTWQVGVMGSSFYGMYNYNTSTWAMRLYTSNNACEVAGNLVVGGSTVTFTSNPTLACGQITSTTSSNNNFIINSGSAHEAGIILQGNSSPKWQIYTTNGDSAFRIYNYSYGEQVFISSAGSIYLKTPSTQAMYLYSDLGLVVRNTANSADGPGKFSTVKLTASPTVGYIWTCSNVDGSGSWQAASGGVSDGDKGDITVSSSGATWTIDNSTITLAKMANMATASLLGRNTAGTGAPEVLSASTAKTLLSLNNVENTALSTWAGTSNITTLGTITTGTWNATAIANSKLANMAANTFKGNNTGSGAAPTDMTVAQARAILRGARNTLTFSTSQNWDLNNGLVHQVTATNNFTLNFPSNAAQDETAIIYVTQDGTGNRLITLGTNLKWAGSTAQTLSTSSGTVDRLEFVFKSSTTATVTLTKDV